MSSLLFTGNSMALHPMGNGFGTSSAGKSAMRSVALTLAEDLAGSGLRVGLLTVDGPTARGTALDPDVIAAEFVKLLEGTVREIIYSGLCFGVQVVPTWMTSTLTALANGHPAKSVGELMPWTAVA